MTFNCYEMTKSDLLDLMEWAEFNGLMLYILPDGRIEFIKKETKR